MIKIMTLTTKRFKRSKKIKEDKAYYWGVSKLWLLVIDRPVTFETYLDLNSKLFRKLAILAKKTSLKLKGNIGTGTIPGWFTGFASYKHLIKHEGQADAMIKEYKFIKSAIS